ncbi:hypothetical protein D5W64_13115 [Salmonella enterica subsp. enterica serovar Saintpaul]|nr:hypothetical protein [Salmonella enterica subsp. enterica serovar Saintpaul]
MSYSDIDHCLNMIQGCESLIQGDTQAPNTVYALTVLKLHASDMGLHAGQEGFMDEIKKGAKNIAEWIIKMIKAIKDYLTSTDRKMAEAKKALSQLKTDIAKKSKESKADEGESEKKEGTYAGGWVTDPKLGDFTKSLEDLISDLESVDDIKVSPINFTTNLSKPIKTLNDLKKMSEDDKATMEDFGTKVQKAVEELGDQISDFNEYLSGWRSSMSEKDLAQARMGPDFNKVFSEMGVASQRLVKMVEACVKRTQAELEASY